MLLLPKFYLFSVGKNSVAEKVCSLFSGTITDSGKEEAARELHWVHWVHWCCSKLAAPEERMVNPIWTKNQMGRPLTLAHFVKTCLTGMLCINV